jgi:hypothetical protein
MILDTGLGRKVVTRGEALLAAYLAGAARTEGGGSPSPGNPDSLARSIAGEGWAEGEEVSLRRYSGSLARDETMSSTFWGRLASHGDCGLSVLLGPSAHRAEMRRGSEGDV